MPEGLRGVESFVSDQTDSQKSWIKLVDNQIKTLIYSSFKNNIEFNDFQESEKEKIQKELDNIINNLFIEAEWKELKVSNLTKKKRKLETVKKAFLEVNRLKIFLNINIYNFLPETLFKEINKGIDSIHSKFPNLNKTIEQREAEILSNIN